MALLEVPIDGVFVTPMKIIIQGFSITSLGFVG
jgi:hypothetical protein